MSKTLKERLEEVLKEEGKELRDGVILNDDGGRMFVVYIEDEDESDSDAGNLYEARYLGDALGFLENEGLLIDK